MSTIRHGIDLVEIDRIQSMLEKHGQRFLDRCFTPAEQAYADAATGRRRIERFAARFAAKEAALKALGTGWAGGIAWTDVEVVTEDSGRPRLKLHGRCVEISADLGLTEWEVSLSHAGGFAMASVIGSPAVR